MRCIFRNALTVDIFLAKWYNNSRKGWRFWVGFSPLLRVNGRQPLATDGGFGFTYSCCCCYGQNRPQPKQEWLPVWPSELSQSQTWYHPLCFRKHQRWKAKRHLFPSCRKPEGLPLHYSIWRRSCQFSIPYRPWFISSIKIRQPPICALIRNPRLLILLPFSHRQTYFSNELIRIASHAIVN